MTTNNGWIKKRKLFGLTGWFILGACFVLFIIACIIGGEILNWYDTMPWYDKTLHAISGALFAIIGLWIGYRVVKDKPFFVSVFAFCFTMTLLVLWEFYEFTMDSWLGTNMLRWRDATGNRLGSGLVDTMWDLIIGAVAALVTCLIGWVWIRSKSKSKRTESSGKMSGNSV